MQQVQHKKLYRLLGFRSLTRKGEDLQNLLHNHSQIKEEQEVILKYDEAHVVNVYHRYAQLEEDQYELLRQMLSIYYRYYLD
ncbi:hypothetical protein RMCBS344292_05885 [Rhizopus microsporus]|nr:hypothetical protein RMCBS344292_05885 [Rhizopus microsporus]